jgi:hypothetical protein
MLYLYLSHNRFSGTPDLLSLPRSLQGLYLGGNMLTGTPNLSLLPPELELLVMQPNMFSGRGVFNVTEAASWCAALAPSVPRMCINNGSATFDCDRGFWYCDQ